MVPDPYCSPQNNSIAGHKVGYYASWATLRACDRVAPNQIYTMGLTHVNFAFVGFDPRTFIPKPQFAMDDTLYSEFTSLKSPTLKTWVSVGGWDFSNSPETRRAFSTMCRSKANRAKFITGLQKFMERYGFQGVDLDWEFPGSTRDAANLVLLVKEMRTTWGDTFGISIAVSPFVGHLSSPP